MASDQSSSSGSGKGSRRRKRKPVTIDLTAEEVKASEAADTPAADKPSESASGDDAAPASKKKASAATAKPADDAPSAEASESAEAKGPQKDNADESGESKASPEAEAKEAGSEGSDADGKQAAAATEDPAVSGKSDQVESTGSSESGTDGGEATPEKVVSDDTPSAPETPSKPASADSAAPAAVAASQGVPRKGAGILGLAAAAVAGGIVTVGILYALLVNDLLPVGTKAEIQAFGDSVSATRNELSMLEVRVEDAEQSVAKAADTPRTDTALVARIEAVEKQLGDLDKASGASAGSISGLKQEIDTLKATVTTGAGEQKAAEGRFTGLETTIDTTSKGLATAEREIKDAVDRIARLEALRSEMRDLSKKIDDAASSSGVARSSLEDSLNGLRTRVDALAKASSTAVTDARLATLEAASGGVDVMARRIGSVEAKVDTMATRVDQAVKALAPEGAQIDGAIAKAVAGLEPRFTALSSSAGELSARVADIKSATDSLKTDLAGLGEDTTKRVDGLKSELTAAIDKVSGGVNDLTGRLDKLAGEVRTPGALDTAALAVAVTRLKEAVDGGRAYEPELAAVKGLIGKDTDLSALEGRAGKGIPTKAALLAGFPAIERNIREALTPKAETNDPIEQVWSGLRSMVKIRSIDGKDPKMAAVAGLQKAVSDGDLAEVTKAWDALPEAGQAVSKAWADDVKARLAVDGMVDKVTADVIGTLSKPTN